MEFGFDVERCVSSSCKSTRDPRVVVVEAERVKRDARLCEVIDRMGRASAKAQHLQLPITTARKLEASSDRVYLAAEGNTCLGLVRVGERSLYLHDANGNMRHFPHALCVLDFIVAPSCQRRGYGKKLFSAMLSAEDAQPSGVALDRPSDLSLQFMGRHFALSDPSFQSNHFVVYPGFFEHQQEPRKR